VTGIIFGIVFLIIAAIIILSALLSPISRKIGFRNVRRRIGNTFLVVIGSMVGAALISGSLVLSDSLDKTFESIVEKYMGESDAQISLKAKELQDSQIIYLTEEETDNIRESFNIDEVDGVLPSLTIEVTPQKLDENGEPVINAYATVLNAINIEDYRNFGTEKPNINDLEDNEAIISEYLAGKLELEKGDTMRIVYGPLNINMLVQDIYPEKGLFGGKTIFTTNEFLTTQLQMPKNSFNNILISAKGGIEPDDYDGKEFKETLDNAISGFESDRVELSVLEWKQDALDGYGVKSFTIMLLFVSLFAIFAGILLIINLYSMLADERKMELGILRAIALTRFQLTKTLIYEGFIYSIISSLIGSFVGLGIGYILIQILQSLFEAIMATSGDTGFFSMTFGFEWQSVIIAFVSGFLITAITTFFASNRISKLRIVEAIRNITEEKVAKINFKWVIKTLVELVLFLASACTFCSFFGVREFLQNARDQGGEGNQLAEMDLEQFNDIQSLVQVTLLYIGFVTTTFFGVLFFNKLIKQFLKKDVSRILISIASIVNIVFTALLINLDSFLEAFDQDFGIVLFFISSVVLVISFSLLITFNLNLIIRGLSYILKKIPQLRSIAKISLRYPAENKQRTGLTLVMFAMIIFLIAYISMVKSTVNVETVDTLKNSLGGYDLFITPQKDVTEDIMQDMETALRSVKGVTEVATKYDTMIILPDYKYKDLQAAPFYGDPSLIPAHDDDDELRSFYNALPANFLKNADLNLESKLDEYSTSEDVWEAVINDSSKVVIGPAFYMDGFGKQPELEVGQKIKVKSLFSDEVHEKEIIATLRSDANMGVEMSMYSYIITTSEHLKDELDMDYVDNYSTKNVFVDVEDSEGKEEFQNNVRKVLINYNIAYMIELEDLTKISLTMINTIMGMFQGFLAFSLIVGICGLSIIILRAVNERRQQIGMLRGLGFQRWMILVSFFIESTFITILGIVIGLSMGTIGALMAFEAAYKDQPDISPIFPVGEILLICAAVYISSMIFALLPSIKAARLKPVEATNYPE
jgi:putative ABC transport system permease protein